MNTMDEYLSPDWVEINYKGLDWRVRKGFEEILPAQLWESISNPHQSSECTIVKSNILRTSFFAPLPENGDRKIFVKRHLRRHWKDDPCPEVPLKPPGLAPHGVPVP